MTYLDELIAHQEWADAEHWRALKAHGAALSDDTIRKRLTHIHQVQHAFLWVAGPRKTEFVFREDFADSKELEDYARRGHLGLRELLPYAAPEWLEEIVDIPWSKRLTSLSRRHALTQAVMHSQYHRAQNATRLREMGGAPPTTDFILWVSQEQPAAGWE
ncbi:MAG TPA: DinB family protein [Candidatus Solibacter sp.]|nr:DinB family protein [Candidatus Solibacter sp.]